MGVTLAVELLQPASHGNIRLASADPAEPPVIDPGYLTADSDLHGLVAGLRIAERLRYRCAASLRRRAHGSLAWQGR